MPLWFLKCLVWGCAQSYQPGTSRGALCFPFSLDDYLEQNLKNVGNWKVVWKHSQSWDWKQDHQLYSRSGNTPFTSLSRIVIILAIILFALAAPQRVPISIHQRRGSLSSATTLLGLLPIGTLWEKWSNGWSARGSLDVPRWWSGVLPSECSQNSFRCPPSRHHCLCQS